ncbi:CvpA family protein [Bacillus rubiinfantis]|uniref:CvpA family protein n=1 Tax=Bacillus rubiinfantis TaxID=1499680 RepID=UPI0005AB016C|nr:CvpA family protein [Bacillus rubiinfantis]
MLDIAIIIFLVFGFFVGLKRGFILQLVHLTSFIIAYIVAYLYYNELAPKLVLWIPYPSFGNDPTLKILTNSGDMESAFYRAISFVILFFAVKIVLQVIGSMLDFIAHLPIIKQFNRWAGGILGFLEVYLLVFVVLYIGALMPIEQFQTLLDQSFLASAIVNDTPILSEQLKNWWIVNIAARTSL